MRTEARVGLAVLLSLVLLVALAVFLGRVPLFERGYEFTVVFESAEGLGPGTPVRMAGVQVGEVRTLRLTPDNRAAVRVRIRPEIRIPVGSRFQVASSTLLGNRYLAILPSEQAASIPPDAVVTGDRASTVEDIYRRVEALAAEVGTAVQDVRRLIQSAQGVVERLDETLGAIQETMADPRLRASLVRAAEHLEGAGRSVERTARQVERVAGVVGTEVTHTARSLRDFAQDLRSTAQEVRRFTEDVTARGETAARLRRSVASTEEAVSAVQRIAASVERTARRVEEMSRDLQEGLINQTQLREVRALLTDARAAARRVDEVMGKIDRTVEGLEPVLQRVQEGVLLLPNLHVTYAVWYNSRTQFRHDLDLWVTPGEGRYYRLGVHDVGRENLMQLQVGFRLTEVLGGRAGLVDSQVGVGLDYQPGGGWQVSLDLTNFNRPTLHLSLHYAVQPALAIGLHLRDVFQEPSYGIGLRYRF
ncbi:MAG: MlaD family protein [Armatimonadota bacterium]|nr:MlaD family protein [Armatimonadota bacterium]MDR7439569.1 MlaD family protein [Armatimonadota bacterium]MDR7562752.1 MlaD family protein [Armatimonadota bacterium]MDR7601051.1 MlaD family protein [Armatimonadota bacterium]